MQPGSAASVAVTSAHSPAASAVRVPFLDVAAATAELRDELLTVLADTADSGWYVLGTGVARFEGEWSSYCGARECVGTGNGFDALSLALRAMGVRDGVEVIVPSNTYIATWLAVSAAGGVPVPVEPRTDTMNLDAERCAQAVTARTRVILPVHLYGNPVDMDAINQLAGAFGLRVLEDAAQAHGARYRGRPAGTLADAAAWSFYPSKNLGALGDAGAVTTNEPDIADAVRRLRNYGTSTKFVSETTGVNSRLDEIQAAVLSVKLAALDRWNARRRTIAHRYLDELSDVSLTLPVVPEWAEPAWHLFVVRTPERTAIRAHLADLGIQTAVHYPVAPHLQPAYRALGITSGSLPISESLHEQVLSLPIGPHLSDDQVDAVIAGVHSFGRSA